jgi:hypothetical protein
MKSRSDVVFQVISGEAVLLDLASEEYYGLDQVGTRVWELVQENFTMEMIVNQLLQEYSVAPDQLTEDVICLLDQLTESGLLEPQE